MLFRSAARGALALGPILLTHARAFTLITFDVDGTLVKGSGQAAEASAHARAFAAAVGSVLGNGSPTPLPAEILPGPEYHGSTDGLISLRLAKAALDVPPETAATRLEDIFQEMYKYVAVLPDDEMAKGIEPLPGVLETLRELAREELRCKVMCGLVTGNVEGIARKKMRAVGVLATGALAPAAPEQTWSGEEDSAFIGGFGSDFCSGDIADMARNHLDRAEQIVIAARRCRSVLPDGLKLQRVVHVGDAPADVLAAKSCAESGALGEGVTVALVAVATGSYSAKELQELAGAHIEGVWEPTVLEQGLGDPSFLAACGVETF